MNETSATAQTGASILPENVGAITTFHFIMVLLVAALAIAIIVAGIRRKRARKQADRELAHHAEQAGIEPPSPDPTPVHEAEQASIVAPPLHDQPARRPEPPRDPGPLANEPIAAAAPMEASPAAEAADPPEADAGPADGPVTQLKGVGPKLATRLQELGFTTVGQIAALTDAEADRLDARLGAFSGRIARDRWIEQARFLAAGDRAGFEAVFGRL